MLINFAIGDLSCLVLVFVLERMLLLLDRVLMMLEMTLVVLVMFDGIWAILEFGDL